VSTKLSDGLEFTWIGHGTWKVKTVSGIWLLIDAYVQSNPAAPEHLKVIDRVDLVILTHGHIDHVADIVDIARSANPSIICPMELGKWLVRQGIDESKVIGCNKGGTIETHGLSFTMVHAEHSSSTPDGTYAGEPVGYVVTFENNFKAYFSGDTDLFGDMRLIGQVEKPDVAFLSIGDFYTMGPRRAAKAVELLGVKTVVPTHYGTRSLHHGRPDQLQKLVASDISIVQVKPGDTI
jgi:L-ascorbate metabolism protein UlaG (beta-lactamase superfamily)